jgi:hypothetical protein
VILQREADCRARLKHVTGRFRCFHRIPKRPRRILHGVFGAAYLYFPVDRNALCWHSLPSFHSKPIPIRTWTPTRRQEAAGTFTPIRSAMCPLISKQRRLYALGYCRPRESFSHRGSAKESFDVVLAGESLDRRHATRRPATSF